MAVIGNIHYAPINDMTWHGNKKLVACSSDGYCSIMTFNETSDESNLIGKPLDLQQIEDESLREIQAKIRSVNYEAILREVETQK